MLYNGSISFYFGKWLNFVNLCFLTNKNQIKNQRLHQNVRWLPRNKICFVTAKTFWPKNLAKNCQHCPRSFSWGWKCLTMTEWLLFFNCKSLFIWRVLYYTAHTLFVGFTLPSSGILCQKVLHCLNAFLAYILQEHDIILSKSESER